MASVGAVAQGAEKPGDVRLAHGAEVLMPVPRQVGRIAPEVTPVTRQGVGRHAAFDRQVIQVAAGRSDQARWKLALVDGQGSASPSGTAVRP
jgi:hypothetical protein